MADRIDNIDGLGDLGFKKSKKLSSTTKAVDLSSLQPENVSTQGFTLEDLTSGDTYTASTATLPAVSGSTELALNYDDMHSLAVFGSVYTRMTIAIDRVKDEYPNGFIINVITTGIT